MPITCLTASWSDESIAEIEARLKDDPHATDSKGLGASLSSWVKAVDEAHAMLLRLSSRSKRLSLPSFNHNLPICHPEGVIDAIMEMVTGPTLMTHPKRDTGCVTRMRFALW